MRESCGLTTSHALDCIQNLTGKLVGADVVEYNPVHESQGITGTITAKLLKENIHRTMERY